MWRLLLALAAAALLFAASLTVPPSAGLLARGEVVSVRVTDRAGTLLQEVRPDGRGQPVTLDPSEPGALPPFVIAALVATEDRRFYDHLGIDLRAVARAVRDNLRAGRVVSGASTIPMQVASFLRADGGPTSTGFFGKLAEAHLAFRLDAHLSKDEVLALWLERAPFGRNAFGIEAASQTYLGKPAHALTLPEAALLVGLPQRPSGYDPFRYPDAARARQQRVLAAMETTGAITPDERTRAAAVALDLAPRRAAFLAPHFVRQVGSPRPAPLRGVAGLSPSRVRGTVRPPSRRVERGEPSMAEIRTTLDADLQAHLEAVARAHVDRLSDFQVGNAALVVLENRTGRVLAYLGSADFWNAAALGQNDGVRMRRQPGSAVKPFTYAQALATRRYTPASILADIELEIAEAGGAFVPENYDRQYHGPVPLREALASSYNVPAVRLAHELGPASVLTTYRRAGLTSLTRDASHYGVGLTLGNGEVSLLELAQAYAGLANGGPRPTVQPVAYAITTDGDTLHAPAPSFEPGPIAADVAYLVTDILRDPAARAPGFGRGSALEVAFPVAVKTGTSKDYRDNWAVGYSPTHTVAVWAGNFDGTPMRWVSGVSGAAPLLSAAFEAIGARGGGNFVRPDGIAEAMICPTSGLHPGASCPSARREVFLDGTVPVDTCRVHRHVQIDARTGLLADAETPAEAIEERLFVVHPPEYHAWMAAHGLPLPPTIRRADVAAAPDVLRFSDRLRVQFPEDGAVFALDPVLRRDYQRLALRAAVAEGLLDVTWWLNGEAVPGPQNGIGRTGAEWPLVPGRHTLELRAVTADGQRLRSRPVAFTVVDAPMPVEAAGL
ncbi:MAG: transglycosylase domain-containing protein [Bacteroidota bacterium]